MGFLGSSEMSSFKPLGAGYASTATSAAPAKSSTFLKMYSDRGQWNCRSGGRSRRRSLATGAAGAAEAEAAEAAGAVAAAAVLVVVVAVAAAAAAAAAVASAAGGAAAARDAVAGGSGSEVTRHSFSSCPGASFLMMAKMLRAFSIVFQADSSRSSFSGSMICGDATRRFRMACAAEHA